MSDEAYIVRSENVHLDKDYAARLSELKQRYRRSRVKAAVKVNYEKLLWN